MSRPCSKIDARLKETERGKKKSAFAKISGRSPSARRQLKSILQAANFPSVPVESQCIKDDKEVGIDTQVMSGTAGSAQSLWDSNVPSYTGILFDSHPLQDMGTLSSPAIQNCFPPETSQVLTLQSHEMADTVLAFSDPKKSGHWEDSSAQSQDNLLYSNINMNILNILDEQQKQQSERHIYKNYASTIPPTLSNDLNFSTSSLSSLGPLQSNSSASITNIPYLPDSEDCLW